MPPAPCWRSWWCLFASSAKRSRLCATRLLLLFRWEVFASTWTARRKILLLFVRWLVQACQHVRDALALQVYETSLEVCLAAGDSAEAFKCMHTLTSELYPETAALSEASPSSSAASAECWASVLSLQFLHALLSLRSPGEACRLLQRAPPAVLASPALRRALRLVRLQRVGNWPGMARVLLEGSSMLRQGLRDTWQSERQTCAVALAASHRGASWAFLERVLGLGAPCTGQTRAALGVVAGAADGYVCACSGGGEQRKFLCGIDVCLCA